MAIAALLGTGIPPVSSGSASPSGTGIPPVSSGSASPSGTGILPVASGSAPPSGTGIPPVALPPLTLRAWLLLEQSGSPLLTGGSATALDIWIAAVTIQNPQSKIENSQDAIAFAHQSGLSTEAMLDAIRRAIQDAFSAAAELEFPQAEPTGRRLAIAAPPPTTGVGWALPLADAVCAEYGWGLDTVLDMPLQTLFALRAAAQIRKGAEWTGPSYEDQDRIETMLTEKENL